MAGQTVDSVTSGISKGLATTLEDDAIADLAKKTATIIGKSIKTMASGFDSTIRYKTIFMDKKLADAGFELGRAVEHYNSKTSDLRIFIDYKKDFKGKLRLTNYDQTGKKLTLPKWKSMQKPGRRELKFLFFFHSDLGISTYYINTKTN